MKNTLILLLIGIWSANCSAEDVTKEQINALDNQVQEVKNEALDISAGMIQLDERFIYPAAARISIFVKVAQGEDLILDKVNIKIDGKDVSRHIYTPIESAALQHGGIHRIYNDSIGTGSHELEVEYTGKLKGKEDTGQNATYRFSKETGAKSIQVTFSEPGFRSQGIVIND